MRRALAGEEEEHWDDEEQNDNDYDQDEWNKTKPVEYKNCKEEWLNHTQLAYSLDLPRLTAPQKMEFGHLCQGARGARAMEVPNCREACRFCPYSNYLICSRFSDHRNVPF